MKVRARIKRWFFFTSVSAMAVWLAVCTIAFAFPRADAPSQTDATYFLASVGGQAALLDRPDLRVGEVVVSRPQSIAALPLYDTCQEPDVTCITPSPETTQGEAEAFSRLAQEHGWKSVTVVSQTSHVTRIRMLMGRCFPGTVRVAAISEHGLGTWLDAFVHETGAMVKVALTPGCYDQLPWER